jgi:hypothetical protein
MSEHETPSHEPADTSPGMPSDAEEIVRVREQLDAEPTGHELEIRGRGELDRPVRLEPSRYAPRFQFFFGVLLALGIVAIGLFVAVATRPAGPPPTSWSQWHPADNGPGGAQQIADHVGSNYRLPDGHQLVTVRASDPLKIQNIDASIVIKASNPTAADAQVQGSSLMYTMCGDQINCAIHGKASFPRGLLLRREAVELALYTFRYLNNADNVVVILPPKPAATTSKATKPSAIPAPTSATVVFLQRGDVSQLLSRPLNLTLATQTPTLTNLAHFPDLENVVALTDKRLYTYGLAQAQDLSVLLELTKA